MTRSALPRGAFLALAPAALLARPAAAQAPALRHLTVASAQDADAAACLFAQEQGMFRKVGLDVSLISNNSGSAVASAVVGGAVDIGKSSLTALITAVSKGIPIVLVAPSALYNVASPVTGTIVPRRLSACAVRATSTARPFRCRAYAVRCNSRRWRGSTRTAAIRPR